MPGFLLTPQTSKSRRHQGIAGLSALFLTLWFLSLAGQPAAAFSEAEILQSGNGNQAQIEQYWGNSWGADLSETNELNLTHLHQHGVANLALLIQVGGGNRIDQTQHGKFQQAQINQYGSANEVDLSQSGFGNDANIQQSGTGNRGDITQRGSYNQVFLDQFGTANNYRLVQTGHGNNATVTQTSY